MATKKKVNSTVKKAPAKKVGKKSQTKKTVNKKSTNQTLYIVDKKGNLYNATLTIKK